MIPLSAELVVASGLARQRLSDAELPEPVSLSGVATLSVIIPVYNEANTILDVLQSVIREPTSKEIVVVDDGSTDGTVERLEQWQSNWISTSETAHIRRIVFLRHPANRGKGAAIRTGLDAAAAEFVIVQDADLEVSPAEYPWLLQPLLAGEADFVIGYRSHVSGSNRLAHGTGILLLNTLVRVIYGVSVRDEACCFKVLRTHDLRRMGLECSRFEFCPEVVAKAARLKLRFAEVPITYTPRDASGGKKLRLRDGLQALWTLWKYRRWKSLDSSQAGKSAVSE